MEDQVLSRQKKKPDIMWCCNNGTIAVRPSIDGQFADLYQEVNGRPQCWLFKDNIGEDLTIENKRSGSYMEGAALLEDLNRSRSFTTGSAEFFVPMSNGRQKHAYDSSDTTKTAAPIFYEWENGELDGVRDDEMPSVEALERLVS